MSKIRYFEHIEYGGYIIQPFSTKRCGKRDYMVLDVPRPEGKKQHPGQFFYIGQAREYINKQLNREK